MATPRTPAYRSFLARLIEARTRAGLTQQQVARALHIPQSRISRMESGERRVDITELVEFARLYRRSLTWFVETEQDRDASRGSNRGRPRKIKALQ